MSSAAGRLSAKSLALLGVALLVPLKSTGAAAETLAFYYGKGLPDKIFDYEQVVLQPAQTDSETLSVLAANQVRGLAYLSVGEVAVSAEEHARTQPEWFIGHNKNWGSDVLDLRLPAVQAFIVNDLAWSAWQKGFRGYFLDTLDSHLLTDAGKQAASSIETVQISLVRRLVSRFPGAVVVLNRGFEIAIPLRDTIQGVAFESLYSRFDVRTGTYAPVSDADRAWLLSKAEPLRRDYGLQVIAIDYLAPGDEEGSRLILKKIESHGFSGWVSDGHLSHFGLGSQVKNAE